ncbi:short-chain fatty acid transporter [Pontibacillus halophilus JSM 076056 = DSM 19796]|uniref:Short-chain fatty acid transporter n=1 Tax=Pontibacillus halophilus JSM 076056 = DSM 19796 TaxID=1385510 RepID=A0A0A5GMK9_9BACI|nr:short-chain fatty acid transporter [Pontibacillus halophilus]KGX93229.1 short-chain fatty acid transporter [Pontibacillus halophilus JSM 076056 = DSM 19796]
MKGTIHFSNRLMQRYLPDPFVFVLLLTFVVFILGLVVTPSSPLDMVTYWGDGFFDLLTFAMQMVLVLVTGYVLASSPFFQRVLGFLGSKAKTKGQAIVFVTLISLLASFINWGFGIVIGALFAKELAKRVTGVDYRLLMASAYSGFIVWHGGISGSIPLTIATDGHFSQDSIGIIPTSETIFSFFNLAIVLAIFIILPLLNRFMMPDSTSTVTVKADQLREERQITPTGSPTTPSERLEQSRVLAILMGLLGIVFLIYYFISNGFQLNLNIVNFLFLFLGILFHGTARSFIDSVGDAVRGAGGIIIQFPFYAGIMGMMVASGLAVEMSGWFVSISNQWTFPFFTFISAGIVNFFVPSGGGQWAVQAPIVIEAAKELGVSIPKAAMAVAWGDAWTNLIQPFWALPALAIAGLKAKDILGFCIITLLVTGVVIGVGLTFLG